MNFRKVEVERSESEQSINTTDDEELLNYLKMNETGKKKQETV